ncbi:MAG: amidohydrolase family protein [Polyangia bacterium]
MRNGYKILDIDRHVMEPVSMWPAYLPAKMQDRVPILTPLAPPGETLAQRLARLGEHALLPSPHVFSVAGEPIMRDVSEVAYIETGLVGASRRQLLVSAETPEGHLTQMDAAGIDVAVMLPTFAPFLVYNDAIDAELSRAYAAAYNRWLRDLCAVTPARLLGAALLSRHDPESLTDDLEEALRMGMRAVVVRPNPVQGRTLSDPAYRRFWAACAHHRVPVLIHEGTHTKVATAGADRFASHFGQHACSHPLEAMMALLSLIEGGVLESNPELRVGFLESGCGWLPYWLWRLDEIEYAQLRFEVRGRVNRPPSEYFRRQCWITIEPGEAMLGPAVEAIGADRILFGTDFPHLDHDPDILRTLFAPGAPMTSAQLRAALWENPARLLGIDPMT